MLTPIRQIGGRYAMAAEAVPITVLIGQSLHMKFLIPGGTGHVGQMLARELVAQGNDVVVLSRTTRPTVAMGEASDAGGANIRTAVWDGKTLGPWVSEIDGSDVVINLAGRTVNCRYTPANLKEMMDSRVLSTRVVGQAIEAAKSPPRVWLQMSTATVYAHRFDAANDDIGGQIGGDEPDAPAYWKNSVDIALAWEAAQAEAHTPRTRQVALRTAMVMSREAGSIFDVLSRLVRFRLGGPVGGGQQYVSWIHGEDFVRALAFLVETSDLSGPVNLAAPNPLPFSAFMRAFREAYGVRLGLPATKWMAEIGAIVLRTDTELLLKSRRVVPRRLLDAGFTFKHPTWPAAVQALVSSDGQFPNGLARW